jgi:hypothetical protein
MVSIDKTFFVISSILKFALVPFAFKQHKSNVTSYYCILTLLLVLLENKHNKQEKEICQIEANGPLLGGNGAGQCLHQSPLYSIFPYLSKPERRAEWRLV